MLETQSKEGTLAFTLLSSWRALCGGMDIGSVTMDTIGMAIPMST